MDGVAEPHSTDDVGPLLVRNTPVVIGQAGPGKSNEYFEGLIDEVKIYTKALSQQEIARECGCHATNDVGLMLVRDTPVVIGQAGPGKDNEYFEGLIDEVKLYSRALQPSDIRQECGC